VKDKATRRKKNKARNERARARRHGAPVVNGVVEIDPDAAVHVTDDGTVYMEVGPVEYPDAPTAFGSDWTHIGATDEGINRP
jgi:hypothetical protein